MNNRQQKTISVLLFTIIIVLVVFFWLFSQTNDLGRQYIHSTGISDFQTESLLFSAAQTHNTYVFSGTPTQFILTTTSTPLPSNTSTFTPTVTSTSTTTNTPTISFTGYEVIGHSVLENPLEVFRFGTGEHAHMIIAGIHGGYEWNTVKLAYELIEYLEKNPSVIPDDKTLYILPNLNPDGYEKNLGPDGRANANNVDINRNWDSNWQATWYGRNCWSLRPIGAGDYPESEPETRALKRFLLDRKIEAVISYHSAAYNIFAGGYPYDEVSLNLAKTLATASPYYFPPNYGDCLYTGQFIDWASDQGIAAVDIELKNHQETDYLINVNILVAFIEWNYPQQ